MRFALAIICCFVFFSAVTPSFGEPPVAQAAPYAFQISREDLLDIAKQLAPRVDLFREVWAIDPEAEFYAGTTRDYLYWILGHFRGLRSPEEIAAAKKALLDLQDLKFRDMVGPLSDADIMTQQSDMLRELRAEDFAIRKLDLVSFDRVNPEHRLGKTERNQGFIAAEKIRLRMSGIVEEKDATLGDGVGDLISGRISIDLPEELKFWETYYAKEGSNHPVLLVLRYLRVAAQDYLKRHGDEVPDLDKLFAVMPPEVQNALKAIIQRALEDKDQKFAALLGNKRGLKLLNGSLQKSFRSFTNATGAFELLKEMGVLQLIEAHHQQIESVFDYLLKKKRNELRISEAFAAQGFPAEQVYRDVNDYLPNRELVHGAGSEEAFRSLIYQGVIPSDKGNAGRGLYGVNIEELGFARDWSKRHAGVDDIVVALKLNPSTKVIDTTKGIGRDLFKKWLGEGKENEAAYERFAETFGADLVVFTYEHHLLPSNRAFVLKNAAVIEGRRGLFKKPRPFEELVAAFQKLQTEWNSGQKKNLSAGLPVLKDFLMTPLLKGEREYLRAMLPKSWVKALLAKANRDLVISQLRELSPVAAALFFGTSHEKSAEHLWEVAATKFPAEATEALVAMAKWQWTEPVWTKLPALLRNRRSKIDARMSHALEFQKDWHKSFWAELPTLLAELDESVVCYLFDAVMNRETLPDGFWTAIPSLLEHPISWVRYFMLGTLLHQEIWPESVWARVPALLMDPDDSVRRNMAQNLHDPKTWPPSFMARLPSLIKELDEGERRTILRKLESLKSADSLDLPPDCRTALKQIGILP